MESNKKNNLYFALLVDKLLVVFYLSWWWFFIFNVFGLFFFFFLPVGLYGDKVSIPIAVAEDSGAGAMLAVLQIASKEGKRWPEQSFPCCTLTSLCLVPVLPLIPG